MPQRKARLRVKRIDTVGLVDSGDDPAADILFFKRGTSKRAETFAEVGASERVNEEIWDLTHRLNRSIMSALDDADEDQDSTEVMATSLDQFTAAFKARIPMWAAGEPTEKATGGPIAKITGLLDEFVGKARAALGRESRGTNGGHTMSDFDKTTLDEAARAEFERLEADATEAAEKAQAAEDKVAELAQKVADFEKAQESGDDDDSVLKGLSDEARAQVAEELAKRDEKITELIEKQRRDDMSIRFTKGNDLEHVGGDERLDTLLAVQKATDSETWDALSTMLAALSKQVGESALFGELGSGSDVQVGGGEAMATIKSKAAELRKADSSLTEEQAIAKVAMDNRDLYEQYQRDQREQARTL